MGQKSNQSGFTLIELSISIIIIGLMIVGAIQAFKVYDQKRKIELTNLRFDNVNNAIKNYALAEGRLPCPAPRMVAGADTSKYGEELATDLSTGAAIGAGLCSGVGVVTVNDGTGNPAAYIGMLPAANLGISSDNLKDLYGNSLIYAVSASLTPVSGALSQDGALILNETQLIEDAATGSNVEVNKSYSNVQYVVVSSGQKSEGGFSAVGRQVGACSADNGADFENCNDDLTFVSAYLSQADAATYFDDKVAFSAGLSLGESSNQQPSGCEQRDVYETYGDTCPDGWEKDEFLSNRPTRYDRFGQYHRSSALDPQQGYVDSPYLNYDSETNSHYFTPFVTEYTIDQPEPNSGFMPSNRLTCRKKATNTSQTKCSSKKTYFPIFTAPTSIEQTNQLEEQNCAPGTRLIGATKGATKFDGCSGTAPFNGLFTGQCSGDNSTDYMPTPGNIFYICG